MNPIFIKRLKNPKPDNKFTKNFNK